MSFVEYLYQLAK